MKKTKTLYLVLHAALITVAGFSTTPTFAQGGSNAGNGGDVIECPGKPLVLLDVIEAADRKIKITDPGARDTAGNGTVRAYVQYYLNRLGKKDGRGTQYLLDAESLLRDIEGQEASGDPEYLGASISFTQKDLQDIDDSKEVIVEPGCAKKQLIVQMTPEVPEDRLYKIDFKLWKNMSNWQKSLGVLHELFLKEMLRIGHENSRKARYLMSFAAQDVFPSVSTCTWLDRIQKAGVWTYTYGGVKLARNGYDYRNDWLSQTWTYHESGLKTRNLFLNDFLKPVCDLSGSLIEIAGEQVDFTLNGKEFHASNHGYQNQTRLYDLKFSAMTGALTEFKPSAFNIVLPGYENLKGSKQALYLNADSVHLNADGSLTMVNAGVYQLKTNFKLTLDQQQERFLERNWKRVRTAAFVDIDSQGNVVER